MTKVFKGTKTVEENGRQRSIEFKNVAVDHVTLSIDRATLFGLLGPNGAGKTTFIRLLSTLLIPDEGSAVVNGHDVVHEDRAVRESVGVIAGGDRGLYLRLTARQNLFFFARLYGLDEDTIRRRSADLLKMVSLDVRADDRVETFSRGMRQRLHIIKSLMHDPPVLLLDEPTLGLDPPTANFVRTFIKDELQRSRHKTIILTTHYMEEAEQLCDEIAFINRGRISNRGTPMDLKRLVKKAKTIHLKLVNTSPGLGELIQRLPGVLRLDLEPSNSAGETAARITADLTAELVPVLVETLAKNDVKVLELKESQPTLVDVYLEAIGESLT